MYSSSRILFILITASTILTSSFAQNISDKTSNDLISGVWEVCVSMEFKDTYQCDKGFVSYEFYADGTWKENNPYVCGGVTFPSYNGIWTFSSNSLVTTYDDTKCITRYPVERDIIWLDNDRFYTIGTEGENGPTVYTFFKRRK
jgi:hypothetical protein